MPNKLFELLKKAFSRAKEKQRYLVQVSEKCVYLHDESPLWQIVESANPIKRGMHRSYDCGGYETSDDPKCQECSYKRVRKITAVEPYSYKRAQALKVEQGTRTLKEIL